MPLSVWRWHSPAFQGARDAEAAIARSSARSAAWHERPGHVCFAASRAEIEGWRKHLEKHGIAIEADFDWPNGAHSIYFRDPSGNSLEIAEPKLWN
ncbi:VOC family protein [Brucella abortus]|uniref:VOC family protein n=1 Tax=Brucella abortus TaxID=235 RepID=UPI002F9080E9